MERSDNMEREQRILNAASELFVHYGYDKTTVSDIARAAGVSKGAIYLHFKSKDEMFESLLIREMETYGEKWFELLEADPNGGTIASMYKNSLYAMNSSNFMSAMFRQDRRVFGNYVRKPDNFFRQLQDKQEQSDRFMFVQMMQNAGAIRQDVDAKVIAHVMDILAHGLVGMEDVVPKQSIPALEELIEGIAALMDRALMPEDGGNVEAGRAIVKQIADAARQRFEQSKNQDQ